MNDGGYRDAAARPKRTLVLRATVLSRRWWLALPLILPVILFPLYLLPTRVEVSCLAVSRVCQVDVERVFGLAHDQELVDLEGATSVRLARVGKSQHLEVTTARGVRGYGASFGGGTSLVVEVIQRFESAPSVDVIGTHGVGWDSFLALGFGLATGLAVLFSVVARVRIVGECDDLELTLRISRWPFGARTLTFAVADLTGVEPRRYSLRRGRDKVATLDMVMRGEREDLFPRPLPDGRLVDELARRLDRFVRLGETSPP